MASDTLCQEILNRGKLWTAEYLKLCKSTEILNEIWENFINNDIELDNAESIEWIRYLMAGGYEPDYFTTIVKKYDNINKCGLIWNERTIAYRCQTCSLASCMSMCSECFMNGDHEGHDYKLFRSETGGCCDCGDSSVMQSTGFCKKHSSRETSNNVNQPPDLLSTAELIAPRVFARLITHLRRSCLTGLNADNYLTMLCEFCRMGAPMLSVFTSALTDAEIYSTYVCGLESEKSNKNHPASFEMPYKQVLDGFENPDPPLEFEHCPSLRKKLHHKTFLEELVFWTLKYEFPEKMTNFLLAMLPDFKYKEALSEAIILHYCHIAMVLERTFDPETLSKRIVNVTVQWILNQYLAIRMAEKLFLVPVMIVNLKNMIDRISLPAPFGSGKCNSRHSNHLVVDCSSKVILECRYWTFVSDLNQIFSYEKLATEFMTNDTLMRMWFSVISRFQGMNAAKREVTHIEYEVDYTPAFLAELSTFSTSFTALLKHLKDDNGIRLWSKLMHGCLSALKEWLELVNDYDVFKPGFISFHIPLHRFFAWLIRAGIDFHRLPLREMLPSEDVILSMIQQPLHILVTFFEIINNLWIRNGLQIKNQALTYALKDFCSSMIDTDVYLLQILATQISPARFMSIMVEKFQIANILEANNCEMNSGRSTENDGPMLESFLQLLAILCCNRTYLAGSDGDTLIDEIVTQIAIGDRTHSEFEDSLPENHSRVVARDIDAYINQVAEYQQPNLRTHGNMQQGTYTPKPCVWETFFDPIHLLLRTGVQKELYQNAVNRYTDYVTRNKLMQPGISPWLPYRVPASCSSSYTDPRRILDNEIFHRIVRSILAKFVYEKSISEQSLSLVVYLLEMALSVPTAVNADTTRTQQQEHQVGGFAWLTSPPDATNTLFGNVNESIVSLLLRVHAILSGKADSFDPDTATDWDSRIGDGTVFVGRVLTQIYRLHETCRAELVACRKRLWPKIAKQSRVDKDGHEKLSEKKRKIEEKRRKILEMYAKQRQKFVDSHPEFSDSSTDEKMDWQHSSETRKEGETSRKLYYCGICKKMLPSTMENPVLLVTLSQASNVLGRKRSDQKRLVCVDYVRQKTERLSRHFSQARWKQACYHVNLGGVYVQSCGHYFDRACLPITNENEYLCPVCRQLANGALPMIPSNDISRSMRIESNIPVVTSLIMFRETSTSLRQLTKPFLDHLQLVSLSSNRRPDELLDNFATISTIALTNIELNIAIRGGSLVENRQSSGNENMVNLVVKKSCLKSLLQVLAKQVTKQNCRYVKDIWHNLTANVTPACIRKSIPLLVQDPNVLLVQIVLVLLDDLAKDDFASCLKYLYSLLYFQIIVQFSYQPNEAAKSFYRWKDRNGDNPENSSYFDMITREANKWMDDYGLVAERKQPTRFLLDLDEMLETKIRNLCVPFLRVAAILQHYLFDEKLPEIVNETSEFECILRYLNLIPSDTNVKDYNSAMAVFLQKETLEIFENWFHDVGRHVTMNKSLVDDLVSTLHLEWTLPRLAKPPPNYELVLKRDIEDPCTECRKTNSGGVCLICNACVCLRKECCKRDDICEGVRHAAVCGAGTGVYLDVLSSQVIVIHLSKAFVWGSLYLDEYDEEDDFLRRGKPLFLSNDRHELLEYQWLSHSFNQIDSRRKWFCHSGSL